MSTRQSGKIKDVQVPVEVVRGRTDLSVQYIASLKAGTIIQLESIAGEPVEVVAAGQAIAKGEVVVIDENFGIRITKLLDTEE